MRKMGPIVNGAGLSALLLVLGLGAGTAVRSLAAPTEKPWLGVMMQALDDGLRDGMNYRGNGVLVGQVVDGSPAEKAGVVKGDVIATFNGRSVDSPGALGRMVGDARVGQAVALVVVRDGQRRTLSARLGARPEDGSDAPDADEPPRWKELGDLEGLKDLKDLKTMDLRIPGGGHGFVFQGMGRGRLGLRVEDLSADLAPYFDAPAGSGALVMEVMKGTPAEKTGIKAGDVVTRIGEEKISDAEDLIGAVRKAPEGKLTVTVLRRGVKRTFEPELEAAPRAWRESGGRDFTMMDPRDRRIVIRRGPGDSDRIAPRGTDAARDELRELREELRDLRQKVEKLQNRD